MSGSHPIDPPPGNFQKLFDVNTWNYPGTEVIALGVSAAGIRHPNELYIALAGQAYWTLNGYNGPDGAFNVLTGYQAGRGRRNWYVYLPTLLMAWETLQDFQRARKAQQPSQAGAGVLSQLFSYKVVNRWGLYGLGYFLGRARVV